MSNLNKPKTYADAFWGSNFCSSAGFEALKKRTRDGRRTCKMYAEYLRSRAKAEDDYSKSLLRSCKSLPDTVDTGNTLSRAFDSMKQETEKMAEVHADLSTQLSSAVQRMTEFINRQKAEIRPHEENVDRCIKNKVSLFRQVTDAKKQYEQRSSEAYSADVAFNKAKQDQNSIATREYDKIVATARKTSQDAQRAYKNYDDAVSRLESARIEWEQQMSILCKMCEEQDGARCRMLQNEMWICCNLLSQTAISVDERSEMIRQKLEKVDVCSDKQAFISACGTGMEKPAPIRFEAYQSQHGDVTSHHSATAAAAAGNNPPTLLPRAGHTMPNAVVMNGRVQPYHGREPPLQIVNRNFQHH